MLTLQVLRVDPPDSGLPTGTLDLAIHSPAMCGLKVWNAEGDTFELSIEREETPDGPRWSELRVERGPIGAGSPPRPF